MSEKELMLFDLIEKINTVLIELYRNAEKDTHKLEGTMINLQRGIGKFRGEIMKEWRLDQ